jgi:hypothetical protein
MKKFILACSITLITVLTIANYKQVPQITTDNTLTDGEKNAGWFLLFTGTDLKNWRTYLNKPGSWKVDNGMLLSHRSEDKQYADLITTYEFKNFEFQVDWKIEPNANSGIMYHVNEKHEHSYESGPEYQILDNDGYKGQIEDWQKTGANYAMNPPKVDAAKPVGQWNHTLILVDKGHVEHWLNGQQVVSYELWSDEWKKEKANGKWKDFPDYGMSKTGHIALQDYHGNGNVWFKNIKIRPL